MHHRITYSSLTISQYTYTFDNHSRLTSEARNGTTVTYTHDNSDQLTADGTTTVTYDGAGNRNNGSYTTGAGNRLTSDGTWTFTYRSYAATKGSVVGSNGVAGGQGSGLSALFAA